ncbi:MAG: hypothetical protein ABIF85_01645 [Nanoarchaeota archaeon]
MVTYFEKMARDLFEQGKKPREVYKILASGGTPLSIPTLRVYFCAYNANCSTRDYLKGKHKSNPENGGPQLIEKMAEFDSKGNKKHERDTFYLEIEEALKCPEKRVCEDNYFLVYLMYLEGDEAAKKHLSNMMRNFSRTSKLQFSGYLKTGLIKSGLIGDANYETAITAKGKRILEKSVPEMCPA